MSLCIFTPTIIDVIIFCKTLIIPFRRYIFIDKNIREKTGCIIYLFHNKCKLVTNETDFASRAVTVQDVDSSQIQPSHQYMICNDFIWSSLRSIIAEEIVYNVDDIFCTL